MQYRKNPKNGDRLSSLGLGCMRFPKKGGKTDQVKTTEMISYAIDQGINYFDTAYIYPGSEEALGKALLQIGKRNEVKIATKLPLFSCHTKEDFDRLFHKQLDRLETDYIDYYFMHMLCDTGTWNRLTSIGIEEWIDQKRKEGRIRNIGFSYHGGRTAFKELIDAYDWNFCMIQFNYLDENNQAGYSGLQYAHEKGLPIFIMEPLRGGFLVNGLPEKARSAFHSVNPERSLADWGLRWVLNHSEVTLLLSGMGSIQQIKENIATANIAAPNHLSNRELDAYEKAVKAINRVIKVPCTGCGYCLPCPKGVDIPTCFSAYNESYSTKYVSSLRNYYQSTGLIGEIRSDASKCVKCGKCETHCPQKIGISKELLRVRRRMHTGLVDPLYKFAKRFI